jgi:hypothetical protein
VFGGSQERPIARRGENGGATDAKADINYIRAQQAVRTVRRLTCGRQCLRDGLLDLRTQAEQARLGRDELLFELSTPCRMGEVAGRNDADTLARGPRGEVLEVEVAAGRA